MSRFVPLLAALLLATVAMLPIVAVAATAGTVREISSFTVPKSPSGMFYHAAHNLLYILCGTDTNAAHYLYAYTTGGTQRCFITIPESAGMTRVDGFQISGTTAYIVDSQGPLYATTAGKLGGSMYAVTWSNPCGCQSDGTCTASVATWSPSVLKTYVIQANDASINDGGGVDNYFRNSGIVVLGDSFFSVNGMHPVGSGGLTCCYTKSITKSLLSGSGTPVTQKWSFTGTTIGRNVDMEGLTCGPDSCATYLYVGDEYNYVYKLKLSETSPATAIEAEFDLRTIVGNTEADKGIEALTYASSTGYFYAGIQGTAKVHVVELTTSSTPVTTATTTAASTATTTSASTTTTAAPTTQVPSPTSRSSASTMCISLVAATAVLATIFS